jgi:alanine-glyoxylate transaminase/serine-glyoxylate transaminase/serine-pyruvate transaminase
MAMRQVGHLDPTFLEVMAEEMEMLRYLFQCDNELTLPISGTGSAAMEASLANVIEPGDVVLVGIIGYFGQRLADMAARYGADVRTIEKPWGQVLELDELYAAVEQHRPSVLALVHGETSSGACQPIEGIGELCREFDCLLLVDTVASLGGVPFFTDDWKVDIVYTGSQKCISCPPGTAPLTFGPRAVRKLERRKVDTANWYLDLNLLMKYWGSPHVYHHTAPINSNYALREALSLIAEEGLAARWARHQESAELFWQGLERLGLSCHVAPELRLPSLTTVRVPEGVDAKNIAGRLLNEYNIEIAGGFGPLAGKVWRVGLMGFNSRRENVTLLLEALRQVLP